MVFSAQPGDQDPVERGLLTEFWGRGPRTAATGFIPELGQVHESEYMRKWRYSAFQRTDLHQRLSDAGRDTLVITGIYANIGIKATALEAFMTDVRAVVVADAVADFNPAEHRAGVEWVARRCGAVTSVQEVLQSWVAEADETDERAPLTLTAISETTDVLGVEAGQLDEDSDLLDAGLDSVRAMELADRLSMRGVDVPFETLIASRTIRGWGIAS